MAIQKIDFRENYLSQTAVTFNKLIQCFRPLGREVLRNHCPYHISWTDPEWRRGTGGPDSPRISQAALGLIKTTFQKKKKTVSILILYHLFIFMFIFI